MIMGLPRAVYPDVEHASPLCGTTVSVTAPSTGKSITARVVGASDRDDYTTFSRGAYTALGGDLDTGMLDIEFTVSGSEEAAEIVESASSSRAAVSSANKAVASSSPAAPAATSSAADVASPVSAIKAAAVAPSSEPAAATPKTTEAPRTTTTTTQAPRQTTTTTTTSSWDSESYSSSSSAAAAAAAEASQEAQRDEEYRLNAQATSSSAAAAGAFASILAVVGSVCHLWQRADSSCCPLHSQGFRRRRMGFLVLFFGRRRCLCAIPCRIVRELLVLTLHATATASKSAADAAWASSSSAAAAAAQATKEASSGSDSSSSGGGSGKVYSGGVRPRAPLFRRLWDGTDARLVRPLADRDVRCLLPFSSCARTEY